jgi:chromosome condensin MukBEF ATPase and DNA-binding subunit MukB
VATVYERHEAAALAELRAALQVVEAKALQYRNAIRALEGAQATELPSADGPIPHVEDDP